MKKLLFILLILISLLSFPYYNNDYIDITHMINVSSIGIDYQNEEFTIYAYVLNNYTMSKSDFKINNINNNFFIFYSFLGISQALSLVKLNGIIGSR